MFLRLFTLWAKKNSRDCIIVGAIDDISKLKIKHIFFVCFFFIVFQLKKVDMRASDPTKVSMRHKVKKVLIFSVAKKK